MGKTFPKKSIKIFKIEDSAKAVAASLGFKHKIIPAGNGFIIEREDGKVYCDDREWR